MSDDKGLRAWESEALKQLSRTLVVIADMLDGIPIDRVLEDIAFEASKKGYSTKPFAHSPVRNRLLNIEKFALALRAAQHVLRRDIKCVCGHGFSMHQTPSAECIATTAGGSADQEQTFCDCDSFVVHHYEYMDSNNNGETPYLPCLCNGGRPEGIHPVYPVDIHPECPIHSKQNDNIKRLTESWRL